MIEHLVDLGVTAVELLPVHHHVSEPFVVGRGLSNYWGYNTLGFFAPHSAYGSVGTLGQQVREFKEMVSALHEAGIEVILDVVYNHTGEGGHEGPTLSFRGLDHLGYYRLTDDQHNDYDVTGCGNSVDTSEPGVLRLVLDSLRYWVTEMGVDGFRFDLVSTLLRDERHHVDQNHPFKRAIRTDPVLSRVKMIAEPWDLGPVRLPGRRVRAGLERVERPVPQLRPRLLAGQHPRRRRAGPAADRLAGHLRPQRARHLRPASTSSPPTTASPCATWSPTTSSTTGPTASATGTAPTTTGPGTAASRARPTTAGVNALRHRQAQNLMATLLLAAGVPMITAGDELGRTQQGNNNAYCQDSPISWVHWDTVAALARPDRDHPAAAAAARRAPGAAPDGVPARGVPARPDAASRPDAATSPGSAAGGPRCPARSGTTAPARPWACTSPRTTRSGPPTRRT